MRNEDILMGDVRGETRQAMEILATFAAPQGASQGTQEDGRNPSGDDEVHLLRGCSCPVLSFDPSVHHKVHVLDDKVPVLVPAL